MVILEDDAGFAADLILNSADMALEASTAATTTRRRNEAAGAISPAHNHTCRHAHAPALGVVRSRAVPHLCLAWCRSWRRQASLDAYWTGTACC